MSRFARRVPIEFVPALCLLVALLAFSSCAEESRLGCPTFHVGAVEGYVVVAGEPISIEVGARDEDGGSVVATSVSDSTGWFRLDLPSGLYSLEVEPNRYIFFSPVTSDTFRITSQVHRHDLRLGRVEVRVGMPEELEGRRFGLKLSAPGFPSATSHGTVASGTLVFDFPFVNPDRYSQALEYPGLRGRLYLPGTTDPALADSLIVGAEDVTRYAGDLSSAYASISGHVTGSWQEAPGPNPVVEARVTEDDAVADRGCDDDGSFTLESFAAQPVRLRVGLSGQYRWIGGDSFENARVFDVQPGDRITGVAAAMSGMLVTLSGPGNLTRHRSNIVVRDAAGNELTRENVWDSAIAFDNLRPGRYHVRVEGLCQEQIWLTQWYDGAGTFESATAIDVDEGELARITVELVEGGRIAGDLHYADGRRPASVSLRLHDVTGEPVCPFGRSFDDGFFEFAGFADGAYFLSARLNGSWDWWYPGTNDFAEAVFITIVDHAVVTGVDWALPPEDKEARP